MQKLDRQPRRHCMIVHAYYPLGETRVQREAEALLKHGWEVDVIALRQADEPAADTYNGVRVHRLNVQRHKGRGLAVQLLEYLTFFTLAMVKVTQLHARRRYHTVQAHNLPDFLVFAAWVPKLSGARLILDLHDLMPEFYQGRFASKADSLPVRLVRLQERLSCRFADHVITVSEHWRQALALRAVPAERCSVVMNVADDAIFKPFKPTGTRPGPRPPDELHMIYHGNVTQRYGLDLALQALARLRDDAPGLRLSIIGNGDYVDELAELIDELQLGNRVTLQETRPVEELPPLIAQADLGIVPYRDDPFTDGLLPTKLMEYMALGLPSIAARTSAIARYFDGTAVEFFTPNSVDDLAGRILALYEDRQRLAELAGRAEAFNRRYNWPAVSAEYVGLIERLGTR